MRSDVLPPRALQTRWWAQWIVVTALILSSSGLAVAASLGQSSATATVVIASLNVRSGPGTTYAKVGSAQKGEVLTVVGQNGNCAWLKIITPKKLEGWVSGAAKYVTLSAKCSTIPAATANATAAQPTPAPASGGQAAPAATATTAPAAAPAAPAAA